MPLELAPTGLVEEITTTTALQALGPAWRELWRRCPRATPFQTAEWQLAWWRAFGNDTPLVLALRWERQLMGLLPLFRWQREGQRVLSLIGSGLTDQLDALVAPGFESLALEAWFGHLGGQRQLWDECCWEELAKDSPLLREPFLAAQTDRVTEQSRCPVLSFPQELPRHKRVNLRRYGRRAAAELGAQIEAASADQLPEALTALFALHSAQWQARGAPGAVAEPAVQAFHREAAPALMAGGFLRFYVARGDGGRILGACYGLQAHGRAHCYLLGSEPSLARYGLGTLLIGHAIEQARREGATQFDFLRGREPYKYTWGALDRVQYRRVVRPAKGES